MKGINSRICRFLVVTAALVVLVEASTLSEDRAFALTPANVPCGLIGWWPLDGNAKDIKNGNNGTVNGGTFVTAMVNKGWKSSGQTNVITVPNASTLSVTNFTVDFWIKVAGLSQGNTVAVWKGNTHGQDKTAPFGVFIRGSDPIYNTFSGIGGMIIVEIGNPTMVQFLQSTVPLPMNQFKHIVVTADGTTLSLYIDGVLNRADPQTLTPANSAFPLQIGGVTNSFYSNTALIGIIDEVEFFNRALDPTPKSEITAIFQAGSLGKCKT